MDFIALKCKLGHALVESLEELIPEDPRTREAILEIYKSIFVEHFQKIKSKLNSCSLTGYCYDDREYPNSKGKQFFECLANNVELKPDEDSFSQTKHYVKLEAIESENAERVRPAQAGRSRHANRIAGQRGRRGRN